MRRRAREVEAGQWIRQGRCAGQVVGAPLMVDEFNVVIVFVCQGCHQRHSLRRHAAEWVLVEFRTEAAA